MYLHYQSHDSAFFILLHFAHSFKACAKITRICNNRIQHSQKSASKYREIAGPAAALPSPCFSQCHQGDTLQGHHCPQLLGDPHHNIGSGRVGFARTCLHSNRQFSCPCHFITISINQTCSWLSGAKPGWYSFNMQVSSQLLCQSSVAGRGWLLCAAHCSAEFRREEKNTGSVDLTSVVLLMGGLSLMWAGRSRGQRVGIQLGQKGGSWKFTSVWIWNRDMLTHVRHLRAVTPCAHTAVGIVCGAGAVICLYLCL